MVYLGYAGVMIISEAEDRASVSVCGGEGEHGHTSVSSSSNAIMGLVRMLSLRFSNQLTCWGVRARMLSPCH